jgi:hypothetical protein
MTVEQTRSAMDISAYNLSIIAIGNSKVEIWQAEKAI